MACPTCDHTMQSIGEPDGAGQRFWCPRCGTLRTVGRYGGDHVPALVERCREFIPTVRLESTVGGTVRLSEVANEWHRLGIAESINTPASRPV